jgi:hypothetical protein
MRTALTIAARTQAIPLAAAAVLFAGVLACDDSGPVEAPPAPRADPGPPPVPTLDDLAPPRTGQATVTLPQWDAGQTRFVHATQSLDASYARVDNVAQVLLGEDASSGVMLTFYGASLTSGDYRVVPATDEARRAHAGTDARVFLATVGQGAAGDLRSTSGEVTVDEVTDRSATGSFDIEVQSRNLFRTTQVRGRFSAGWGDWLSAQLEHQDAIRDELGRKRR